MTSPEESQRRPRPLVLRAGPTFSPEIERRKERQDAMPVMFEWYKHLSLICIDLASVPKSRGPELQRPARADSGHGFP